ncbi:MAG: hypothetical protein HC849_27690 [Oscillatoriales cyanobacterium RU_3_3]|nr:hypothetical protein [Microcoleus sp. SU_5_6]NJL67711.1 hypothetical protein [Microcoleus sp. SM1_3_4]NJM63109.1 hypothetical protein [Oscillatoriales cyanobacterium RU_3_3]NJR24935.1 hypothetical protein [Richelia sp. CSU_2_1]
MSTEQIDKIEAQMSALIQAQSETNRQLSQLAIIVAQQSQSTAASIDRTNANIERMGQRIDQQTENINLLNRRIDEYVFQTQRLIGKFADRIEPVEGRIDRVEGVIAYLQRVIERWDRIIARLFPESSN